MDPHHGRLHSLVGVMCMRGRSYLDMDKDQNGMLSLQELGSFGSGMLFAVPVLQTLLAHFRTAPVRAGRGHVT